MLRNMVGVVTGGASGLGKATAMLLAQEGCKITIFDLPGSPGKDVQSSLKKLEPDAMFVAGDVRSEEEVDNLFSVVDKRHSKLDFVVHCAGISFAQKAFNKNTEKCMSLRTFNYVFDTNVFGAFNVLSRGARLISKNTPDGDDLRGSIITTFGSEAFDGQLGQVCNSVCSGGMAAAIQPLSRDLSESGIRVNGICVGVLETPLTQSMPEQIAKYFTDSCVLPKRFGKPEEFAHCVKFLLENKYMNASIVRLEAGLKLTLF